MMFAYAYKSWQMYYCATIALYLGHKIMLGNQTDIHRAALLISRGVPYQGPPKRVGSSQIFCKWLRVIWRDYFQKLFINGSYFVFIDCHTKTLKQLKTHYYNSWHWWLFRQVKSYSVVIFHIDNYFAKNLCALSM